MSSINKIDVVGEYLREVDLRLSGLPLLQRHELLADLRAHIDTAREQGAYTDSEMIEVLQRLGSPEAIAAAAYWEAGPQPPRFQPAPPPESAPPSGGVPGWVIATIAGVVAVFIIGGLIGFLALARVGGAPAPATAVVDAPGAPHAPDAPDLVPAPRPTQ
ncbi:HAAS signaling domain-containing protein [Actinoplanes sp. NPDC049265]|uniref:HAAS signaling domain-containing protein n=1 Tax=Actinoplanes sp. NPDC049265 TaxID=3363902 RepID=UPI00371F8521